ncbi:recombinase family protein [Streptomyces sp. NPDC005065]|uniref:recombinase family protein n=1 Tax=unclassified Streptomyces TaxID=2593676 RepID=UPI0033A2CD84
MHSSSGSKPVHLFHRLYDSELRTAFDIICDPIMDLGEPGREFEERKIEEIKQMARGKKFDALILWIRSRFGRNLRESLQHLDALMDFIRRPGRFPGLDRAMHGRRQGSVTALTVPPGQSPLVGAGVAAFRSCGEALDVVRPALLVGGACLGGGQSAVD